MSKEIRLKEYGSESIEVWDNGIGIKEEDFEGITGKHFTSKLREFDDLSSVRSYGFRGEALSSLCHLSKVIVHTCSTGAAVGTRLEFDSDGLIVSRTPLARARGTTVTIQQLFHNLPVRRRHLTDPGRATKEFAKALNVLTAYCLVSVGVQISCYRSTKTGEKILVVSNGSSSSISNNIAQIFGQQQLAHLNELVDLDQVPSDILDEYNAKCCPISETIRLRGFISKPPSMVDDSPKSRLTCSTGRSSTDRQFMFVNNRPCDLPRMSRLVTELWRRCSRESLAPVSDGIRMPLSSTTSHYPVFVLMLQMPTATVDLNLTPDKRTVLLHHEKYVLALIKATLVKTLQSGLSDVRVDSLFESVTQLDQSLLTFTPVTRCRQSSVENSDSNEDCILSSDLGPAQRFSSSSGASDRSTVNPAPMSVDRPVVAKRARYDYADPRSSAPDEFLTSVPFDRPTVTLPCSMLRLRRRWTSRQSDQFDSSVLDGTEASQSAGFSLGIFRATKPEIAESELSSYFRKSTFNNLQIVGQFNLGFIIARHRNDLFIIDQHASDEKFRFEQLCENYRFTCQPLVAPQPLDLPVGQTQLLLSNLDIFAKNGFSFHVDESAPCGKQVQLVATPMLEGIVFGRSDIEEMLFVLAESYSRRCRPSRLRDILASRACRGAVMIGTPLDASKMERIVKNMSTMEHPWNCPHGRPTIRHLFHLGRLGIN